MTTATTTMLTPLRGTIPDELKARIQWVTWRLDHREGESKPTKVPYRTQDRKANPIDPTTWLSFEAAYSLYERGGFDGIGFVFSPDDPYCGIDLDPELPESDRQTILQRFGSYTELSPSGHGQHIIVKAKLPGGGRKKGPLEVYAQARYFTMTGRRLLACPDTIEEQQETVEWLLASYFPISQRVTQSNCNGGGVQAADDELLARAFDAKNGDKLRRLYNGDTTPYPSASEADLSLASTLAFWTGPDPARLERLLQGSRLVRDKWGERHYGDGQTYLQAVIAKALSGRTEFYTAGNHANGQSEEQAESGGEGRKSLADALVDFKDLLTLRLPERKRYLPWLAAGSSSMVFGSRGVGKTCFGLGLATALTTATPFLRWPISDPVGVLYIDGEMQLDELRTRAAQLLPEPPKAPLKFLTSELVYHRTQRDLVLTSDEVRAEIMAILDGHSEVNIVIFDNVSALFSGIDEDRKRDWEPIAAWLIKLRHRGLATLLVHHAGNSGRQRGTSGREDSLDAVINLMLPAGYNASEGCHFELRFTKSRSVKGDDVAPLDAKLTEQEGRLTWIWSALEESKLDQVKALLVEGVTSVKDIAEELDITKGYASKLLRKAKAEQ